MDPTKDILQSKWPNLKDQVRHKWSKLTAEDIAGLSGKAEELASVLRLRYRYGRIEADMEIRNWLRQQQ
ncbi:MAG: CsbD family protein [Chloroflexi bacterium]|nr:CsbD family protein [Chloroflexota bacterium]